MTLKEKISQILLKIADANFWKNLPWLNIAMVIGFFIIIILLLTINIFPSRPDVEVGKPSTKEIRADKSVVYEDVNETRIRREKAAQSAGKAYKDDPTAKSTTIKGIEEYFSMVDEVRSDESIPEQNKLAELKRKVGVGLPESVLKTSLSEDSERLGILKEKAISVDSAILETRVSESNLAKKQNEIRDAVAELPLTAEEKDVVANIASKSLKPNYILDPIETKKIQDEEVAKVGPVYRTIKRGDVVVKKDKVVTESDKLALIKLDQLYSYFSLEKFMSMALITLGIFLVAGIFSYRLKREIWEKTTVLFILFIITIAFIIVTKIFTMMVESYSPLWGYLIPLAALSMVVAILFEWQIAVMMTFCSSIFVGLLTQNNFEYLLVAILGGLFSIFMVSHLSRGAEFRKVGFCNGLAIGLFAFGVNMSFDPSLIKGFYAFLVGFGNGIFSTVLTIGGLYFLETSIHITTPLKLLELSNPNKPLLKELMEAAPGTYNHSLMVANLSEVAAEAIGANSLYARVSAYYHDIGKIKYPEFFVENQKNPYDSQHDNISPHLSALIITSHVKEGVELGKKYKLPQSIICIINEHHGNSVVSYFYHRAKRGITKFKVEEDDFRYSSDKPKSRESAIVMLADSVEAATKALRSPTPNQIEQLNKKIIQSKVNDGQLDESNLTLAEINKIVNSFVKTLTSVYRQRVSYPEIETKLDDTGEIKLGDTSQKSAEEIED